MGFFNDILDGFLELAQAGLDQSSELAQCTKFIQAYQSALSVEGMDEEAMNRATLDALKSCGAAETPNTLLGEIYPICEKRTNENAVNISLPTAHETCPAKCPNNRSKCGECLKERLAILEALNYAENPALYRQTANAQPPAAAGGKCSLCGAPINGGVSVCEYCGTPVTGNAAGAFGASAGFVPSSTLPPEQQAYELIYRHQLSTINEMNEPEAKKVMINVQCAASWSVCPTMSKAEMLKLTEQSINETMPLLKAKMSLSDLYFMADHYHMSVPTYLRGLFDGDPNLKTAAVFRKEQQEERERELRQQQAERDRQIREEKEAKLKQIQQENHRRQLDMINKKTSGYVAGGGGGGSSRCCGTCVHYMSASNRCTEHTYSPNGASDWCSSYCSK